MDSLYLSAQYNNRTAGLFQYQMETGQKLAYTAINERGVTELYGMYMDQKHGKEPRGHSLLYSNLPNVQALAWADNRLLCLNRQPTGSYQLYRFTLKNE